MRLVTFGATGPTGRQVVQQATAAGHDVTAVIRNLPASSTGTTRVRFVRADVADAR